MANNPFIYNAVIQGATGGIHERWLTNSDPNSYLDIRNQIVSLASLVDALIPTNANMSTAQSALMQSISQGVFSQRYIKAGDSLTSVAQSITALWQTLSAQLLSEFIPNGNILGGGVGTVKGVAVDGVAGTLADLTGKQVGQNFRRSGIQDVANASGVMDVILLPGTNVLRVQSIGNVTLNSMQANAPVPEGYEVLVQHDRGGAFFLTIPSGAGAALFTPYSNANGKAVVLGLNGSQWYRFTNNTWRMNNNTASQVALTVTVPALAAGVLGYVDTTLIGTPLEGTISTSVINIQPGNDFAVAGAGNGYLVGARISGTNLRTTFVGALSAGDRTVLVATL